MVIKSIFCAALCVAMLTCIALIGEPSQFQNVLLAGGSGLTVAMVASFGNVDTLLNVPALLVGTREPVSRNITLLSGQNCIRGTVLGKIGLDAGAVTVGAAAFTGTGDGVLTPAVPAYGVGVQTGTYTSRLVEGGANSGQFEVRRPDGTIDGYATVGTAYNGQVKFTIADGATDFSGAAQFTQAVTIADTGAAKYVKSLAAAVDGSQVPAVILAEDCDASLADKVTVAYFAATVDENALTYGTGHTAATCREPLRDVGIDLQYSIL